MTLLKLLILHRWLYELHQHKTNRLLRRFLWILRCIQLVEEQQQLVRLERVRTFAILEGRNRSHRRFWNSRRGEAMNKFLSMMTDFALATLIAFGLAWVAIEWAIQ